MTGRCHHCRARTIALPGAQARKSRPNAPMGFKRGFVVEKAAASWLICSDCMHRILLAAA